MRSLPLDAARRIALGAQGFNTPPLSSRVDVRHFRRVMKTIGLVQLDSVNVCVRTHYMPFYSRLGPYNRDTLDDWLNESGENFEYWAHAAASLPVERYPLWRWKMGEMKVWRSAEDLLNAHPELTDNVLEQVRERGPLTVSDLDAPNHRSDPWWGYGPGKIALEVLFGNGKISARRTGNFKRLYDMPERMVATANLEAPLVTKTEAHRALLRDAVRHLGIGTVRDISDYFRLNATLSGSILEELASRGEIVEVRVEGWDATTYMDPDAVRPRCIEGATLLSPFDPITWFRERAARLFDFMYKIEIYVPEPERVYGYYTLPFMLDGELVGRVDLKADRERRALLVRSAWIESDQDQRRVASALRDELVRFAGWLELEEIEVADRGNLSAVLTEEM